VYLSGWRCLAGELVGGGDGGGLGQGAAANPDLLLWFREEQVNYCGNIVSRAIL